MTVATICESPVGGTLVDPTTPDLKQIAHLIERFLKLVIALSPIIGHEKARHLARYALDHDLTPKEAALQLQLVSADEFDRIMSP